MFRPPPEQSFGRTPDRPSARAPARASPPAHTPARPIARPLLPAPDRPAARPTSQGYIGNAVLNVFTLLSSFLLAVPVVAALGLKRAA